MSPDSRGSKGRMDRTTRARLEARARVFKALAHPSRLCIVSELAAGERCVCELARFIGADVSTASRHLAQLKGAGLVSDEKRGLQVFYTLRVCCIPEFLECVESVLRTTREESRPAPRRRRGA